MVSALYERFVAAFRQRGQEPPRALCTALRPRLTAAELATPGVSLSAETFAERLVDLLVASAEPAAELGQLHVEDLYFAWALEGQDRAAVARFEREFLARLVPQLAPGPHIARAEVEQNVRTRLLVAEGERPARIRQYTGRGPFGAWLRMVGKRTVLDMHRARGSGGPAAELESPSVATDPELDYLKLRYAADFKLALEGALRGLPARQVTLLKLTFIEQLPAASIGVMYGVSGRTVQRWLVEVKEAVLHATRDALKVRLSLSPSELDSLLGLMQSQLHVSLSRVLDVGHPTVR